MLKWSRPRGIGRVLDKFRDGRLRNDACQYVERGFGGETSASLERGNSSCDLVTLLKAVHQATHSSEHDAVSGREMLVKAGIFEVLYLILRRSTKLSVATKRKEVRKKNPHSDTLETSVDLRDSAENRLKDWILVQSGEFVEFLLREPGIRERVRPRTTDKFVHLPDLSRIVVSVYSLCARASERYSRAFDVLESKTTSNQFHETHMSCSASPSSGHRRHSHERRNRHGRLSEEKKREEGEFSGKGVRRTPRAPRTF